MSWYHLQSFYINKRGKLEFFFFRTSAYDFVFPYIMRISLYLSERKLAIHPVVRVARRAGGRPGWALLHPQVRHLQHPRRVLHVQVQGRMQRRERDARGVRRRHPDLNRARTNILEATEKIAVMESEKQKPYICVHFYHQTIKWSSKKYLFSRFRLQNARFPSLYLLNRCLCYKWCALNNFLQKRIFRMK